MIVKTLCVALLVVVLCCGTVVANLSLGEWLGHAGLGALGRLVGATVAVITIAETTP